MALYEITGDGLRELPTTTYAQAAVRERDDLQRLLRDNIAVLGEGLLVIAEEYGDFDGSGRRIDLLAIDAAANLIVIELKRTGDGGHMELQALRYAAMVSAMTWRRAVETFGRYLASRGRGNENAEQLLLDHLDWEEPAESDFARRVRILLASAGFGQELTTAVLWLNEQGLDITCVQLQPHALGDGRLLLDARQVIPLPEAADYQVKLKEKSAEARADASPRAALQEICREFWTGLINRVQQRGVPHPIAHRTPGIHLQMRAVEAGTLGVWVHSIRQHNCDAMFQIIGEPSQTNQLLAVLVERRDEIERVAGVNLDWEEGEGRSNASIRIRLEVGGYRSPREEWPAIQDAMIDAMIRLEAALRPHLEALEE